MKNKDYNTIETFKKSFKDVFGDNAEITLDHTFDGYNFKLKFGKTCRNAKINNGTITTTKGE